MQRNIFEGKYCLHYRSEIEECPDQDMSKMQAKLSIVPIDQLSLFIGKKVSAASTHSPESQGWTSV